MNVARLIRVVLAEECELVRDGLGLLLQQELSIRVVRKVGTVAEAGDAVARLAPDVVVIDVAVPEAIRQLKQERPTVRVLVLSARGDEAFVSAALRAGADGFVLRNSPAAALVRVVLQLALGERGPIVDPRCRPRADRKASAPADALSERERQILSMIAEGCTSKAIARRLQLSPRTVDNHRARIMAKLQVDNCVQAAARALNLGLIALPGGRITAPAPRRVPPEPTFVAPAMVAAAAL